MSELRKTTEQSRDVHDSQIVSVGESQYDPEIFQYYDDVEEYGRLLLKDHREMPQALDHELSHGICALAVGIKAVKYGFEVFRHNYKDLDGSPLTYVGVVRPLTSLMGPSHIPNLAYAAIQAAPEDPSESDIFMMKKLGYSSVDYLQERIDKWNRQENSPFIPMPGTIDIPYESPELTNNSLATVNKIGLSKLGI